MTRKLWTDLNDIYKVDAENYLATKVYEEDPEWSGLYDKDGKKLIRAKQPIGFVRKSNG